MATPRTVHRLVDDISVDLFALSADLMVRFADVVAFAIAVNR